MKADYALDFVIVTFSFINSRVTCANKQKSRRCMDGSETIINYLFMNGNVQSTAQKPLNFISYLPKGKQGPTKI